MQTSARPATNWPNKAFLAVAPDLFWRQEPGVDLSVTPRPTGSTAFASTELMIVTRASRDVKDTVNAVANLLSATARLPSLAIVSARLMTFLTAVRCGRRCRRRLSRRRHRKIPGRGRQSSCAPADASGEEDEFISKAAQAEIKAALAGNQTRSSTAIRGSGTPSRGITAHYNAAAAAHLANGRTSEFLRLFFMRRMPPASRCIAGFCSSTTP
jgi:carboxymethylenebutenolidase